jgi:hypothetical protein
MRPATYSIPIGIAAIALAGIVMTGCSGSGLRSGRDGGEADAVASLGGQAGSTASAGGAGGAIWTTDTAGAAGSPGTGGSADAGGVVGSGGATGLGGTKGCCSVGADAAGDVSKPDGGGTDGNVVCGPVCLIYCAYGNVVDENGCETCGCKPPPTVNPTCPCAAGTAQTAYGCLTCGYCTNGYVLDANGCPTCSCNPPSCPAMKCASCPYGYLKDASGCPTCTCLPDCDVVCTIDCQYGYPIDATGCPICACNPPPACPARKCQTCTYGYAQDFTGCLTCTCLPDPSLPCKQLDASQCGTSTHCRWLVPGCGMGIAPLPDSGCYEKVDCLSTSDCSETGSTCVTRSANPNPSVEGGDWCGMSVSVCL